MPTVRTLARRIANGSIVARLLVISLVLISISADFACGADPIWRQGDRYEFRRLIRFETPGKSAPGLVVTEFLTHGQLKPRGSNIAVFDHEGAVPWRVLQTGPGDFCRVAFMTTSRKSSVFQIYYGGTEAETSPAWPEALPLLVETRGWKECNLNALASVRAAFETAPSHGSNFVPQVFHRWDPITTAPRPFFSHYSGTLHVTKPGNYLFFTSSEDASFLLINDREVVAAPGRHGPTGHAQIKGQIALTLGTHRFDYWHAAHSGSACMVAAWQPPGAEKPELIPSSAFGARAATVVPTVELRKHSGAPVPDFVYRSVGEVPLADSNVPLLRVEFEDVSFPRRQPGLKVRWDFGDGQSSEEHDPTHIYLQGGRYVVKLTHKHEGRESVISNEIQIERPLLLPTQKQTPDELASYLPTLETYNAARCDGPSLRQLVRAFEQHEQWKSAVTAGQAAFKPEATQVDEESRYELAQTLGPLMQSTLHDPAGAAALWAAASQVLTKPEWRAYCEVQAADLQLNDLNNASEAKKLIDNAARRLKNASPEWLSRLHRVRGDVLARQGFGVDAREAYAKATKALKSRRNEVAQNAWRGAHSRSVEAHLRADDLVAARESLDRWLDEFPLDRVEGYWSLLMARYWFARQSWSNAAALGTDLLSVNASSPYADQLLHLAAQSELKLGQRDRAIASYRSLITEYPGSPLVDDSKQQLARLTSNPAPVKTKP